MLGEVFQQSLQGFFAERLGHHIEVEHHRVRRLAIGRITFRRLVPEGFVE